MNMFNLAELKVANRSGVGYLVIRKVRESIMQQRYDSFARTGLGRQIAAIIDRKDRQIEFNAFSREGFPAVTALVFELSPELLKLKSSDPKLFNFAKQFVGAYVGDMMKEADYSIDRPAKAVPGKLFTVGAVWAKNEP